MTVADRADVVGHYTTAGLGGSVQQFFMPEGINVQLTVGRAVNGEGEIHLEGIGVVPNVRVPVTEDNLFSDDDPCSRRQWTISTACWRWKLSTAARLPWATP